MTYRQKEKGGKGGKHTANTQHKPLKPLKSGERDGREVEQMIPSEVRWGLLRGSVAVNPRFRPVQNSKMITRPPALQKRRVHFSLPQCHTVIIDFLLPAPLDRVAISNQLPERSFSIDAAKCFHTRVCTCMRMSRCPREGERARFSVCVCVCVCVCV